MHVTMQQSLHNAKPLMSDGYDYYENGFDLTVSFDVSGNFKMKLMKIIIICFI